MESVLDIICPACYHVFEMESKLSIKSFENILYICTGTEHGRRRYGEAMKNHLERLRRERGINQEELAAALEVSRQTIGSLENGRYNPSILLAFKIARYFGMTIEEIFIYEEETK